MVSKHLRASGVRTLVLIAVGITVGAAVFVWLMRIQEPANALEGRTFDEVLRELQESPIPGVADHEACVEHEILTADGYSEPHGLRQNAEIPRDVRALVERRGISFEDYEQRHISDHGILLVSRDRIKNHRFDGVEIYAHIISLHWVAGGSKGVSRFEIEQAAAILAC